jgi:hypothetical protein
MKMFLQMLICVFFGVTIGVLSSWSDHQSKLIEVRVIRVVKTREDSSMRFVNNLLPHTIVEYRPPIKQFAVPGIAGEVGEVIYELPPVD